MNKWHLVKEKGKEGETLCGRTSIDGAFIPKTARQVTDQLKIFYSRPCIKCLKILKKMKCRYCTKKLGSKPVENNGKYYCSTGCMWNAIQAF